MGKSLRFMLIIFFLCRVTFLFSQNPAVVISSYFNAVDPRDEWTELLVLADNTNMFAWILQDNNATQTAWQLAITFNNPLFWDNMRAGTVIVIWHRQIGSNGIPHPVDADKSDGYIEVSANDPTYFSGGNFGTNPLYAGPTLNIAAAGDLLVLQDPTPNFVHALGHRAVPGTSWTILPLALTKLNYKSGITDGTAVCVCPGSNMNEYGNLAPQDGTTWTSSGTGAAVTRGLPNTCLASATANSDFWRSLRQPTWINPVLTGNVNAANDLVTLNWNPTAVDPFPADSVTGYLILRNTSNTFGAPLDGHTYTIGNNIGGASVIALITGSQKVTYPDAVTVPCPSGFYYRIYSYRYGTDNINGNDYNMARGRAYNENVFGEVHVTGPGPVTPVSAVSDRDSLCINDAGNITLSATGGSGVTLNWFTGSCGGTLIGAGTGANNSITIPSPTATTTYYARWESTCGVSSCASVTVTVLADFPVSVFITASINPVCISTPVIFTASPVNPGPAPAYQWKVNGVNAGTNSNTYSYTPANGDNVSVVLTSDAACPSGNPATSNTIVMSVSSAVPVSAGISAAPGDSVCTGTTVTYTATPVNGGANPSYQWFLNGTSVGGNNPAWSNIPVNGDTIYCKVTSSLTCASNNPATSDTVIIAIIPSLPVSVNIAAVPSDTVCTGTTITYTATPVNGGTNPSYQWFLNGNPAGGNSPVWSTVPSNGDVIYCQVTSDYSCATNNPASSNTINVTVSSGMPVSVSITAAPNDTICSGTAVTFTATLVNGGPTPVFQWYLNGIPAGADNAVYTVTPADGDVVYCSVTSSLSCAISNPANSNSIKITHSTALTVTITISANHTGICPGTVITFTAVPSNEGTSPVYDWLVNGVSVQTGNSPVFTTNSLAGGESVVCRLTSSLSCLVANPVSSAPISIPRAPAPVVKLTDKPYLCVADAPRLDAGAGFTTYLWQDGSTGRYITATKPDVYRVTVTDSLGCTASDSALVKVCETLVFVPDAFTPNGDGLNDEFKAITSQEGITEFSMRIFNRWGELIFESTDVHIGWNGMVKGQVASPGTYVWKIVYQVSSQGSPSGSSTTLQGTVTLVR